MKTDQNLVKILTVFTKKAAVSKGASSNHLVEVGKLMLGLIIDDFILTSKEASQKRLSANHYSSTIHCQYS